MGTKQNPSAFDCYSKIAPDEPLFVLRARDRAAPATIRFWALERLKLSLNKHDDPQIVEAFECSKAMERYSARPPEPEAATGPTTEPAKTDII